MADDSLVEKLAIYLSIGKPFLLIGRELTVDGKATEIDSIVDLEKKKIEARAMIEKMIADTKEKNERLKLWAESQVGKDLAGQIYRPVVMRSPIKFMDGLYYGSLGD